MAYHEIRRRYPRLIKLMCSHAILSENEAVSAINDHQMGLGSSGGCEAVAHYGGANKLLTSAVKYRFTYQQLHLVHAVLALERGIEEHSRWLQEAEDEAQKAKAHLRAERRMRAQMESELLIARRRAIRVRASHERREG
jgi:hypothetical protein